MHAPRRFSQAISEGDGISLLAEIGAVAEAEAARQGGAEALVVRGSVTGLGEAGLPVLWCAGADSLQRAAAAGASALLVPADGLDDEGRHEAALVAADEAGLEAVFEARDEGELTLVLDRLDPEILLLSGRRAGDRGWLEAVLDLLGDVPAGKLAVAELDVLGRDEVDELERAGVDGVVVPAASVAALLSRNATA